jgi:4-amino-4-deoxychorismate lyase
VTEWEPARTLYERKACISQNVKLSFHPYSRFKTLSALPYVMAGIEKKERQMDEMVLCDMYGRVSEASAMNIFWQKDKKLYTPSLNTGCIEGIMRSKILDAVKGIQICEVQPDDLIEAEAIVTCNVTGIYPIDILEGYEKERSRQLVDSLNYLIEGSKDDKE